MDNELDKELRDELWGDIFQALANYRLMHKARGDEIGAQLASQHLVGAEALKQHYDDKENENG